MLELVLLGTGVVLVVNGWSMLGGSRLPGAIALNLLLGGMDLGFAGYYLATGEGYEAFKLALFGITYAWYGINMWRNVTNHQRLGWYCLLVAVAAVPISLDTFRGGDAWFGSFWMLWSGLWLLFFLIMGLGIERISRFVGRYTLAVSLGTCLVPGTLIASGAWQL
ncbi:AmiS/UreI family transporter [Sporichthya sp.]|uniref:AmiS/UreI family transporter n=1 Tax=Sporichthya sp. TaxID=65475 RepID=UPI001820CD01|nr:AmiS/UreI family transporter [Sporichthya sp.]MBA3743972.1 AmiS/UreI transporter [Sporichthya sp.]